MWFFRFFSLFLAGALGPGEIETRKIFELRDFCGHWYLMEDVWDFKTQAFFHPEFAGTFVEALVTYLRLPKPGEVDVDLQVADYIFDVSAQDVHFNDCHNILKDFNLAKAPPKKVKRNANKIDVYKSQVAQRGD